MQSTYNTEMFDIFIIEIEIGLSYDSSETTIKLVTASPERAQEAFDNLNSSPHGGWQDYAQARLIGSISDVTDSTRLIASKSLELSTRFDEMTVGDMSVEADANSEENHLHQTLWQHECALSSRKSIKSSFRDLNLNALN